MKLPENSLYAILLRSRWWASLVAGAIAFALIRLFLPTPYAVVGALPFLVIAAIVLKRQLVRPSARKIAATLERARAMSADEFARALEAGFRRAGYSVERAGGGADLELSQGGRLTLVACRRWKAMRHGVEPLREFHAATADRGAAERLYVAVGEITGNARAFAREKSIRLVEDEELSRLLAG